MADSVLFYKKENIFAKKCFATKAKLNEGKQENDIVVGSCTTGPNHPEMWIKRRWTCTDSCHELAMEF